MESLTVPPPNPAVPVAAAFLVVAQAALPSAATRHAARANNKSPRRVFTVVTPHALIFRVNQAGNVNVPGFPQFARDSQFLKWEALYYTPPEDPVQSPPTPIMVMSREITLPFDLGTGQGGPMGELGNRVLASLYPWSQFSIYRVGTEARFLVIRSEELPPGPWPLTIAGLPTFFTLDTSRRTSPLPRSVTAPQTSQHFMEDMDHRRATDWSPLFDKIKLVFEWIGKPITEVMYMEDYVVIVLEVSKADLRVLPQKVANVECRYMCESLMKRPQPPRKYRREEVTPGDPDEARYATLRPGLRICSPATATEADESHRTTAGVLVSDGQGARFLTIAPHGLRGGSQSQIHHPLAGSQTSIGRFHRCVGHTGIGLVRLHDGTPFANETFQSDAAPKPVALRRLAPVMGRRRNGTVFIDSPDTDCLEATSSVTSYRRVEGGEWVLTCWFYLGQNMTEPIAEGVSGAAVWTGEGDVLGFFEYVPVGGAMEGWTSCVAADELIYRGLSLVDSREGPAPKGPRLGTVGGSRGSSSSGIQTQL